MASTQLQQATSLITSMLITVAVAVVAVGLISLFVSRRFGGKSKAKRQIIFHVVSGIGFLGVMFFVYLRTSGHGWQSGAA